MKKSKSISRAPGYYHLVIDIFIIINTVIIYLFFLSIFIANKFVLKTVNKNFS